MSVVRFLGRHATASWAVVAVLWLGAGVILMVFIRDHGRFPQGSGELWNWVLGL